MDFVITMDGEELIRETLNFYSLIKEKDGSINIIISKDTDCVFVDSKTKKQIKIRLENSLS